MEIHDSVLRSIDSEDGVVTLILDTAYIHRSEGVPGVDAGTGYAQAARLVFETGRLEAVGLAFPLDLASGTLELDNEIFDNVIPIPLNRNGKIVLKLEAMWGRRTITVRGTSMEVILLDGGEFAERFPGAP